MSDRASLYSGYELATTGMKRSQPLQSTTEKWRFRSARQLLWLLYLLLGLIATQSAGAQRRSLLGHHPEAQTQPTEWGQSLHSIHLHGDHLYLGYGDYSANTGPIAIRSYDIATETFSPVRLMARTEAIHQWRSIGGRLFGLMADANFSPSQGGYFSSAQSTLQPQSTPQSQAEQVAGRWTETLVGPGIHSYDIASHGDALYLSGAGSPTTTAHASLYKSIDAGATWQLEFELPPPEGGYGRFYGVQSLDGALYAFASQTVGSTSNLEIYQLRGEGWLRVVDLNDEIAQHSAMMDLVVVAGAIVGRNNPAGLVLGRMLVFDGRRLREIEVPDRTGRESILTYDHAVANGELYALTGDFRIVKTTDLQQWQTVVANVSRNARSLAAVDDCEIYVGGVAAGLHRYGGCSSQ